MFPSTIILLAILALLFQASYAEVTFSPTVNARVKNAKLQGEDSVDFSFNVPLRFENFLCGLKYKLTSSDIGPESLYAKKTVENILDGKLTVDGDYRIRNSRLKLALGWMSEKFNLRANAHFNNLEGLSGVEISKSLTVNERNIDLSAAYDALKKKFKGGVDLQIDATNIGVVYDSEDNDVVLAVSYDLDEDTKITPSVSSKADLALGLSRKWTGGSMNTVFKYPDEKLVLEWNDDGTNGSWQSTVEIPIRDTKNTKFSLSRDFVY